MFFSYRLGHFRGSWLTAPEVHQLQPPASTTRGMPKTQKGSIEALQRRRWLPIRRPQFRLRLVVLVPYRGALLSRGLDASSFPIQCPAIFRIPRLPLDFAFDGIAADRALVLRVRPLVGISGLEHIIHVTHCVIMSCERNVASVERRILQGQLLDLGARLAT